MEEAGAPLWKRINNTSKDGIQEQKVEERLFLGRASRTGWVASWLT